MAAGRKSAPSMGEGERAPNDPGASFSGEIKAATMTNPESSPSVFEHGSAWVRADFHMHTLADKEFVYSKTPNYFVSDYVAALKSAGIRVAVITNHNKFDRDEFKTLAKYARKQEIFLLTGLELSVKPSPAGA